MTSKFWVFLACVLVCLQWQVRGQVLRRRFVKDAVKLGAVCADHSPAVFYTSLRPNETRWIVFFESGGVCTSMAHCRERLRDQPHFMSSRSYPEVIRGTDLLSDDPDETPFARFNRVLVPYCSGDLFLGHRRPNRISTPLNSSYTGEDFAFTGRRIVRQILRELRTEQAVSSLSAATEVLLAGSSAGGLASLNHVRWAVHRVFPKTATVSILLDSAWFVDFYGQVGQIVPEEMRERMAFSKNHLCRKRDGPAPCCISASCLLESGHVRENIRVLVVNSRHDVFVLGRALTAMAEDGLFDKDDDAVKVRSAVSEFGGIVNATLTRSLHARPTLSVVQVGCAQHVYTSVSTLWTTGPLASGAVRHHGMDRLRFENTIKPGGWSRVSVGGRTIHEIIREWWEEEQNATIRIWDGCEGLSCNPTCPDRLLISSTLGPTWSGLPKWLAIGLAAGVVFACLFLKLCLWIAARLIHSRMEAYMSELQEAGDAANCLPEWPAFAGISVACHSLTYSIPVRSGNSTPKLLEKKDAFQYATNTPEDEVSLDS